MDILHAVIQVLKERKGPVHYKQIAKEIGERGLAEKSGQTLETLVNAQVGVDIRASEDEDRPPRFRKLSNGMITLTEFVAFTEEDEDDGEADGYGREARGTNGSADRDDEEDDREPRDGDREDDGDARAPEDPDDRPERSARDLDRKRSVRDEEYERDDLRDRIDDYNMRVAREYARELNGVDFATFERHIGSLIRSFAVRRYTIVNRRKDGGMDYAVNLGHLKNNLNLLIAVRRWGNRRQVTMADVRETFERMKVHGFNACVYVTSGDFDDAVYDHADTFKEFPFFLVNGDKLAWLMLERRAVREGDRVSLFQLDGRTPGRERGRPPRGARRGEPRRDLPRRDVAYPDPTLVPPAPPVFTA